MSSTRELYKLKSRNGLGSRDARARLKAQESKSGREALLSSKRRIPLSAVQEEDPPKREAKCAAGERRLQQLKEWKAKRDTVKEKEKKSQKKPFNYGAGIDPNATRLRKYVVGKNATISHTGEKTVTVSSNAACTTNVPKSASNGCCTSGGLDSKISKPVAVISGKAKGNILKSNSAASTSSNSKSAKGAKTAAASKQRLPPSDENCALNEEKKTTNTAKPPPQPATRASKRIAQLARANGRGLKKPAAPSTKLSKDTCVKKPTTSSRQPAKQQTTSKKVFSTTKSDTVLPPGRVTRNSAKKRGVELVGVVSGDATSGKKMVKRVATPVNTKLSYHDSSSDNTSSSPEQTVTQAVASSSSPACSNIVTNHTPSPQAQWHTLTMSLDSHSHNISSIPDSAWIPNQHVSVQNLAPSFKSLDDALGPCTFSPFKFTTNRTSGEEPVSTDTQSGRKGLKRKATPGRKPFTFTFRKSVVSDSVLPLQAGANIDTGRNDGVGVAFSNVGVALWCGQKVTLSDEMVEGGTGDSVPGGGMREEGGLDDGVPGDEVELVAGVECDQMEEVVVNAGESHTSSSSGDKPDNCHSDSKEGLDFPYFFKLHDDVADSFKEMCSIWKMKSEALERKMETEDNDDHLEEVIDQIRTVVGQAQLLMTKKMKQYVGLVTQAQHNDKKTSDEDLQGFWDMVSIQVDDVRCKFERLAELERNDWKQPHVEQNRTKKQGKKRGRATSAKTSGSGKTTAVSEKQAAARERRNVMRSRLRQMKMEAVKRTREGDEGEGVIAPTETLATPHHDDCIQDNNSHRGSNKRRSTRSRQSEMEGEELIEETTDTPSHDNGRRSSSSRKSTGKGRGRSRRLRRSSVAPLIDFSQLPTTAELTSHLTLPPTSPLNPSGFSPTSTAVSSCSVTGSTNTEVPTAHLINCNDQTVNLLPLKSPLKYFPMQTTPIKNLAPSQGSVQRFVSITPSKRIREVMDIHMVMSPARRSIRIAEKFGDTSDGNRGNYQVTSLKDLPEELDFGYLPNKALF